MKFLEQYLFGQGIRRHQACSSNSFSTFKPLGEGLYLLGELTTTKFLENLFRSSLDRLSVLLELECRLFEWTSLKYQMLSSSKSTKVILRDAFHDILEAS